MEPKIAVLSYFKLGFPQKGNYSFQNGESHSMAKRDSRLDLLKEDCKQSGNQ